MHRRAWSLKKLEGNAARDKLQRRPVQARLETGRCVGVRDRKAEPASVRD